jgi:hypothetical protein
MSLPIVLEIATGLIFIYLTLSLIASEIQEILSALFQWRAEHLKRSIEQLLSGDRSSRRNLERDRNADGTLTTSETTSENTSHSQDHQAAKNFADKLYESPLIEGLNYQAQGRLAGTLRSLLHGVGALYRLLTFSRNVFGANTSGPSYIPAETFASSLIERLRLDDFQRLLMRSRFKEFAESEVQRPLLNMLYELRASLGQEDLLSAEIAYFERELQQVLSDLDAQRISLEAALQQLALALQTFETMVAEMPLFSPLLRPTSELSSELSTEPLSTEPLSTEQALAQSFFTRVRYLRNELNGHTQKTDVLLVRMRPSLAELTALLDPGSATYAELVALAQREGGAVLTALEKLQQEAIPPRLRESLATLGVRAERRVQTTGAELQQFQAEIEDWFNHGMERASGVYRRNVKGVGILIGLAIAFTLNADTLYMLQRLSTDQAIRSSIVQSANQLEGRGINSAEALAQDLSIDDLSERIESDLRSVSSAVEATLADYPLPIGRAQNVLAAQRKAEASWPIPFIPQRFVGWSITALALSMGASFWFDLLRKVTSVRSTGDRPKP